MKLIDFFDCTYIINLPERKDRRTAITQELTKVGISLTPNKIQIFPAIKPIDAKGFPNIGARGCFLSHLAIIKEAKERQLTNVLIMEDDLILSEDFQIVQEKCVQNIQQKKWGFVYLGHKEECELKTSEFILKPVSKAIQTTHFYGINSIIFDPLIDFLSELQKRPPGDPQGGPMHVDGAFSTFRKQNPDILTLIACPSLGSQRSSASDISPNWFDRIVVLRQLATLARNTKTGLKTHLFR
ncbi:MAG: glycosyltransferase family 25 protein [Nostocaceae cyanobacterium]|nr:glycosyltransferase family 25 protein [Nostocaceae cyanobacterium]